MRLTSFWAKPTSGLLGLLTLAIALGGCGGGGGGGAQTDSIGNEVPTTTIPMTAVAPEAAQWGTRVVSITRVSETLVSGLVYDYVFNVVVANGTQELTGVSAVLASAGIGTTIIDGNVYVGDLAASAQATPVDTITLRHDRSTTFNPAALIWRLSGYRVAQAPSAKADVQNAVLKPDVVNVDGMLAPSANPLILVDRGQNSWPIGKLLISNGAVLRVMGSAAQPDGSVRISTEPRPIYEAFSELAMTVAVNPLVYTSAAAPISALGANGRVRATAAAKSEKALQELFSHPCLAPKKTVESEPGKFGYSVRVDCTLANLLGISDGGVASALRIEGEIARTGLTTYQIDLGKKDNYVVEEVSTSANLKGVVNLGDATRSFLQGQPYCKGDGDEVKCVIPITKSDPIPFKIPVGTTGLFLENEIKFDWKIELTLKGKGELTWSIKSTRSTASGMRGGANYNRTADPVAEPLEVNWIPVPAVESSVEIATNVGVEVIFGKSPIVGASIASTSASIGLYVRGQNAKRFDAAATFCWSRDAGIVAGFEINWLPVESIGFDGIPLIEFTRRWPWAPLSKDLPSGCSSVSDDGRFRLGYVIAGRDYYSKNDLQTTARQDVYDVSGGWLLNKPTSTTPYFLIDLSNIGILNPLIKPTSIRIAGFLSYFTPGSGATVSTEMRRRADGTQYLVFLVYPGNTKPGESLTFLLSAYVDGKKEKTESTKEIKLNFEQPLEATPVYRYSVDKDGGKFYFASLGYGVDTTSRMQGGYVLMSDGSTSRLDLIKATGLDLKEYSYFERETWLGARAAGNEAVVPVDLVLESKATYGKPGAYHFKFTRDNELKVDGPITVTPISAVIGETVTVTLTGKNLPQDLLLSVPNCNSLQEQRSDGSINSGSFSTEFRKFRCVAITAGNDLSVQVLSGLGSGRFSIRANTDLPQIVATPTAPSVGGVVEFVLAQIYKLPGFAYAVWDFGAGIATQTAQLADKVYQAFSAAGTRVISVVFLNATNNEVGRASTNLTVSGGGGVTTLAQITAVQADNTGTVLGIPAGGTTPDATPTLIGTINAPLDGFQWVRVYEGTALVGTATVSGQNWSLTTPILLGGIHQFRALVARGDGVQGAPSLPWALTVACPQGQAPLPAGGCGPGTTSAGTVTSFTVSPALPKVGDTITLKAEGVGLLNAGYRFSNFTPCATNGAVAPTVLTDVLMSYQCVASLATTISYVGVLESGGTPLPGIGQALTVYCTGGVESVGGVCAAAPNGRLPDTGVTSNQCYRTGSDALVSCTSVEAIALNDQQDGMITPGSAGLSYALVPKASGGSYDTTECVKDNITGLVWEGKTASGLRSGTNTYTNYDSTTLAQLNPGDGYRAPVQAEVDASSNAIGYRNYVNSIALCGYGDWRLPTVDELWGLVDFSLPLPGPMITTTWFPNSVGGLSNGDGTFLSRPYWTSTALVGVPFYGAVVNFADGALVRTYNRSVPSQARLVRSSTPALSKVERFIVSADGTEVSDRATGLVWQRCQVGHRWDGGICATLNQTVFFAHEAALSLAKAAGAWRLPNTKELASLLDPTQADAGTDQTLFPGRLGMWASTPALGWTEGSAYHMAGNDGTIFGILRPTETRGVRLVR